MPWVAALWICKKLLKTILFLLCWGGVSCSTHGIREKSKEDISVITSFSVNNLLEMVPRGSSMEDGYCMLIVLACCVLAPAAKPPRNVFSLAIAVLPHDSLCSHFYFCLMAHLTSAQQHILSLCIKLNQHQHFFVLQIPLLSLAFSSWVYWFQNNWAKKA